MIPFLLGKKEIRRDIDKKKLDPESHYSPVKVICFGLLLSFVFVLLFSAI